LPVSLSIRLSAALEPLRAMKVKFGVFPRNPSWNSRAPPSEKTVAEDFPVPKAAEVNGTETTILPVSLIRHALELLLSVPAR